MWRFGYLALIIAVLAAPISIGGCSGEGSPPAPAHNEDAGQDHEGHDHDEGDEHHDHEEHDHNE